jgi:hypothetical protein
MVVVLVRGKTNRQACEELVNEMRLGIELGDAAKNSERDQWEQEQAARMGGEKLKYDETLETRAVELDQGKRC